MRHTRIGATLAAVALAGAAYAAGATHAGSPAVATAAANERPGLWRVYQDSLSQARYIDLTHDIAPTSPVWKGFGPSQFFRTVNPETGEPYTYEKDGFEATGYHLSTDQLATQFDPPAHWDPYYPAINEIPATYSVRPLVVISIVPQVQEDPGYQMQVTDILAWERRHGRIPEGSVVFIRSDWSKRWTEDPEAAKALAADPVFPGITLAALQFLHLERHILFHGHEPLDTDTTPTLEGESWLMHNGYTQAEGVANLEGVPEARCLVSFGFPKFKGGVGGYARYIAICPQGSTDRGVRISEADAPLPRFADPLHWDEQLGYRTR
jgi:kynurenine formamidase